MDDRASVAIIGAGPAGLAVGACLRRAGVDFIILEKEREAASSWRRHYERLHLHTVKRHSALPYLRFPDSYPRYVPRHLMVQYLDAYADHFDLHPRFGETIRNARRTEEGWSVDTTSGRVTASHLVVATGGNAEAVDPAIVGLDTFKGTIAHSAAYANAAPFVGQTVLVIGMGNTGAEIALDLAENDAHPTISVRNGVHIVPRDLFGVPIQVVAMAATRLLPQKANDKIFPPILDFALGDLKTYGIKRPSQGILERVVASSRIPVIDVGTVRAIKAGAIKVAPAIETIVEDGAVFADGRRATFDAIILATGYRPNYHAFLDAGLDGNAAGTREDGASNGSPYFVGFHNPVTGLLRQIGLEAVRVASEIRAAS